MKKTIAFSVSDISKFKFKKDSYARSRGAPVMLAMICVNCDCYVMSYQKDGPGPLIRCYLDRIHHPEMFEKRQYDKFDKATAPKLSCPSCQTVIGSPIIYEKENRLAYHLRPGFFALKKISNELGL